MRPTTKMLRRVVMTGILIAIALTALAGCTTLPQPADPSDTAFVLPVIRVSRSGSSSTFGYYEITVTGIDDPSVSRTVKVYAGTDMRIITGLEPGRYTLSRYQFVYKEGGMGSRRDIYYPFILEAGAITISPTSPTITLYKKDPNSSTNWMRIQFNTTQPPTRQEVLSVLREEEAFAAWRVLSIEESRG